MTKDDVLDAMEDHFASYYERDSGNLMTRNTIARLAQLIGSERQAVVSALSQLLSHRAPHSTRTHEDARAEARLWLAASAAEDLRLVELIPDLERLIDDVEAGRTMLPVHATTLRNHLQSLQQGAHGDTR